MDANLFQNRMETRRSFFFVRGGLSFALLLGLLIEVPCHAQSATDRYQQIDDMQQRDYSSSFPGSMVVSPVDAGKRLRALNANRQKKLVADTEKLLKLAAELNAELEKSNQAELSSDQKHKVGEIEKLAHKVREQMAASAGVGPVMVGTALSAEYR